MQSFIQELNARSGRKVVTVYKRDGEKITVQSPFENNAEVVEFASVNCTRSNFAVDLISKFRQRGTLSPKQTDWLWVIATQRFEKLVQADQRNRGADAAARANGYDFSKIREMFDRLLGNDRKRVSIQYNVGGTKIRLKLCTKQGDNFGVIYLDNNEAWGSANRQYYGKIDAAGRYFAYNEDQMSNEIKNALRKICDNPVELAKVSAQLTGICCFCGLPLETRESVAVGYGPVCSQNWGLPWGDTSGYEDARNALIESATNEPAAIGGSK